MNSTRHRQSEYRRRRPGFFLPILLLLHTSSLVANGDSDRFILRQWNVEHGLPQSTPRCYVQTRQGYLWIGTWNGLSRFDGLAFRNYTASNTPGLHSSVMSLYEDTAGRLWIGTDGGGLYMYNPVSPNRFDHVSDLEATRILDIGEDREGRLWLATESGVYVHASGRFERLKANDMVLPTFADQVIMLPGDEVFLGFSNVGIRARWKGLTLQVLERFETESRVGVDSTGEIWYCRRNIGLIRRSRGRITIDSTIANGGGVRVAFTSGGERWIISPQEILLDKDRERIRLTSVDGVALEGITGVIKDAEGNFWLGKEGGGLLRLQRRVVHTITKEEGVRSTHFMTGLEDRRGTIWMGALYGGLVRREAGERYFRQEPAIASDAWVMVLCESRDGTLWVGGRKLGLHAIRNGRTRHVTTPTITTTTSIIDIAEDPSGGIWILTIDDGVVHLNGEDERRWTTADGLTRHKIGSMLVGGDGSVWLGTSGGGINRIKDGRVTVFGKKDGLLSDFVSVLREDEEGGIWLNVRTGLQRRHSGTFSSIPFEGRLFDDATQLIQDKDGNFWYGGTQGIHKVSKHDLIAGLSDPKYELNVLTLGKEDGMLLEEFGGGSPTGTWRTQSGVLWFTTSAGAVVIDPEHVSPNSIPPGLVIEETLVDHKLLGPTTVVTVNPGQTVVEIRYAGISLSSPQKVRFAYVLEGFDNEWTEAGTNRRIEFTNLSPGSYRFRLRGVNSAGYWNMNGPSIDVIVLPYFWETWWFRVGVIMILFVSIGGTVRFLTLRRVRERLRLLEKDAAVEKERRRIAADMHDDLGARLTKVSLHLDSFKRRVRDPDGSSEKIEALSRSISEVGSAMDELIWSVNPKYDSLDGLLTYIQQYSQEFFEPTEIKLRFELPESVPSTPLSVEERHALFAIVKEALNNAAKHAQAVQVKVQANLQGPLLQIIVQDDGIGFEPASVTGFHNGVRGMHERLRGIGGIVIVDSTPGKGTSVRIICPLERVS